MEYVLFVLIGFVSALVSAVFGFGTALLVISVGAHVLPVKEAIVLGSVLFAASTVTKTIVYRQHIDWKVVGVIAVACVPFSYVGSLALSVVAADGVQRAFGAMVLLYVLLTNTNLMPRFRVKTPGLMAGSAIYGFVSGFLGSGNLIKVIMFREMAITKEAFVGAMAATAVMSNLVKLMGYWQGQLLWLDMIYPALGLTVSAVVSVFLGKFVLRKISPQVFETGVKVILCVAAAALLL